MAQVSANGSDDPFSNIPIDDFSKSTQQQVVDYRYPGHGGGQQYPQQHPQYQSYAGNAPGQYSQAHPYGQQQPQQPRQQQRGDYPATQAQNPFAPAQTPAHHAQARTQMQAQTQAMAQMTLAQPQPQRYHNLVPQQQQQQQQHMVQQQQQHMVQQQQQHHQNVVPPQQVQYHAVEQQHQFQQHHGQQYQQQQQVRQQPDDQPPANVNQQQHHHQNDAILPNLSALTSSSELTKPAYTDLNYPWLVDDVSSIDSTPDDNATKQPQRSGDNHGPSDDNEDTGDIYKQNQRQKQEKLSLRLSHSSTRSYNTESSFVTNYSVSPLDKSTFAPPPTPPESMEIMPRPKITPLPRGGGGTVPVSISTLHPSHPNGPSPLPSFSRVTHSGHVSARLSPKSLILKKWRRVFWVTYGDTTVLVFRSRADFDEWASNPYLSVVEREAIVKLRVEFKRSGADNLGVKCYRASPLRSKDYGKSGKMCMFKLEQWMHHGPVVVGAFASASKPEIGSFQIICNAMIERQRYGVKHLASDSRDEIADGIIMSLCSQERT